MRQATAILLTLLLLVNVLGYYGVFLGFRYQQQQTLLARIDRNHYQPEETITFKVPLAVPYALEQTEYTRVDGEFSHQGEYFRLVKQRLSQDTLYVVCIKDRQGTRLHQALTDYVKTFTGKPVKGKEAGKLQLNFIKDYLCSHFSLERLSDGWVHTLRQRAALKQFLAAYTHNILLPPELA